MKFLIVGLGSMGCRRVRNLKALDQKQIAGFDINLERAKHVAQEYAIDVYDNFDDALKSFKPDALMISTSPDMHIHYAFLAYQYGLHCFIEASVVDAEKILELHHLTEKSNLIFAPSCTMCYMPTIKKVKELLEAKAIGKVLNINYQVGQYLPDWHPWEDIKDYYVSKPETGGGREIVPFELTWLMMVFGKAKPLTSVKRKLSDMDANIDDLYHCLLQFDNNIMANVSVEVLSRPVATRELRIIGDQGLITLSGENRTVRYIKNTEKEWHTFHFDMGTVLKQYINPEEPYISEINDFLAAISTRDQNKFPNTLAQDYEVLQTLNKLEALNKQ